MEQKTSEQKLDADIEKAMLEYIKTSTEKQDESLLIGLGTMAVRKATIELIKNLNITKHE